MSIKQSKHTKVLNQLLKKEGAFDSLISALDSSGNIFSYINDVSSKDPIEAFLDGAEFGNDGYYVELTTTSGGITFGDGVVIFFKSEGAMAKAIELMLDNHPWDR